MPRVNPDILVWAREAAGLSREEAVDKLAIQSARGVAAVDRLAALEAGAEAPSRAMLMKMAKQYRRPLLVFYMSSPPRKGDRGQDFRTLPEGYSTSAEPLLDALIRDIQARQSLVRSVLEDEEEAVPLPFVGSATMADGIPALVTAIRGTIGVSLADFRGQLSVQDAFALLRAGAEAAGIFVLLAGNLGSHHTAIDLETFRGFALADPIAPFVVINDQDARSAWSFTLVHELAHVWLGVTGVSGASPGPAIERFCNDVAGEFLLPAAEIAELRIGDDTPFDVAFDRISEFARERNISRTMVAYKLLRERTIDTDKWRQLSSAFREQWLRDRETRREKETQREGGPSYYVVRRHRLGSALLTLVKRTMKDGALTPTKAGKILGVKPRNVEPLLSGVTLSSRDRAA